MSDNRMADVAKILGVEFYEEFKVGGYVNCICRLTPDWFERKDSDGDWESDSKILVWLLNGKEGIERVWRPKQGDFYYCINASGDVTREEFRSTYLPDVMRVRLGNYFRSRLEAEKNKRAWLDYLQQVPDLSWRVPE